MNLEKKRRKMGRNCGGEREESTPYYGYMLPSSDKLTGPITSRFHLF